MINNVNNLQPLSDKSCLVLLLLLSLHVFPPAAVLPRALRRHHCVSGGAPVSFWSAAAGPKTSARRWRPKNSFSKGPDKIRSILKVFRRACLVIDRKLATKKYTPKMTLAARTQQIDGCGGAAWPTQGSRPTIMDFALAFEDFKLRRRGRRVHRRRHWLKFSNLS